MEKELIICPKCHQINKKKDINIDEIAICFNCGYELYRNIKSLKEKILVISLSSIVFFIISIFYPIINLEIVGYYGTLNLVETIFYLFKEGYVFLSVFSFFTLIFFPFLILINTILFIIFLKTKKISKFFLINITLLKDFIYLDIFFIAILVSMIKILDYGYLSINIGFYSFIVVFVSFFILFKFYNIKLYWELYDNI